MKDYFKYLISEQLIDRLTDERWALMHVHGINSCKNFTVAYSLSGNTYLKVIHTALDLP